MMPTMAAAVGVYSLSCAPGVGLSVFAVLVSFGGTFEGTLGLFALMAIFTGSFALITLGLIVGTAIWIVFDANRKNRPRLLLQFAEMLNIAAVFQTLLDRSLPSSAQGGPNQAMPAPAGDDNARKV